MEIHAITDVETDATPDVAKIQHFAEWLIQKRGSYAPF